MNIDSILSATDHRPWPLPSGPWLILQSWREVLFAHWPVEPATLRAKVPLPLEIDTHEGRAWISIAAFRIDPFQTRGLPLSIRFPELNLRTYVRHAGREGVYFFSLDATSSMAVLGARTLFRLNYFNAAIHMRNREGGVDFTSRRLDRPRADFHAWYTPKSETYAPVPGSLDHWLTERYCLFAAREGGRVFRVDIHHLPWVLQSAEARIGSTTLFTAAGLPSPEGEPLLHYSLRQDTLTWGPDPDD